MDSMILLKIMTIIDAKNVCELGMDTVLWRKRWML
jgi:hypothetical protein